MDEIDEVLERMRSVLIGRSVVDDARFAARLEASARRGGALALVRSATVGVAMAAAMVIANPLPTPTPHAGGAMLTTWDGTAL